MRRIISYAEFEVAVGAERIKKILTAMHEGFQDSIKVIEFGNQLGVPVEYEIRGKANLAHDHMKARLKNVLSHESDVEIDKWNGIFALKFGETAFCRIKKFLKGAEVSCIMTFQQKKFNGQFSIEGIPDSPTFLTIGYYVDKAWSTILGIYVACWSADGIEWFNRLGGEGFTQLSLFPEMPRIPVAPATPAITPEKTKRVTGKKDAKKDTGTDNV